MQFHPTSTLLLVLLASNVSGAVTYIRFNFTTVGGYSASFSEIDVVGTAVPEPSQPMLVAGALGLAVMMRKRSRGK